MSNPTTTGIELTQSQVEDVVRDWLARFVAVAERAEGSDLSEVFCGDPYWRDLLVTRWDLRTHHGLDAIETALAGAKPAGLSTLRVQEGKAPVLVQAGDRAWIQAVLSFESDAATGVGVVNLIPGDQGEWKAWTLLTALDAVKGHPLQLGERRPLGSEQSPPLTWLGRREAEQALSGSDPAVVIVGAGQSGLSLAANLRLLGVRTLVLDKNARIGDNWRQRYDSLVLHDPVWADHLPFLPFPESWPLYTPKDKLANWLEIYAEVLDLTVWTSTTLESSRFDEATGEWALEVTRGDGSTQRIRTHHVVMATGFQDRGAALTPDVPGRKKFSGTCYHSAEHRDALGSAGKKVVVVGAASSAHDIARDFALNGADVTMVQRSATYVMSQEHGEPVMFGDRYKEGGPPTEESDLLQSAFPMGLVMGFARHNVERIAELDKDLIEGLQNAGFAWTAGPTGAGLLELAYRDFGGYYINVGASELIIDGTIKVASGSGLAAFTENGIVLEDGTELAADVVVLATGFATMRERARVLFGDVVADRCDEMWGLDEEGEIRGIYRPSGHPNFWVVGGQLLAVRIYTKYLALQILGVELGMNPMGAARS